MCAKEDFSGYHNFITTYKQISNARKYQRMLNKKEFCNCFKINVLNN